MAKQPEFNTALVSFLVGFGSVSLTWSTLLDVSRGRDVALLLVQSAVVVCLLCAGFRQAKPGVALRASCLGVVTSLGVCLVVASPSPPSWRPFGVYATIFCVFHFGEYLVTAVTSPRTLGIDSFLLNHSKQYWLAAVCSWLEFALEATLLPACKRWTLVTCAGVVLCVVGEALRKGAMLTAQDSFTHLIAYEKRRRHRLIMHGVYALFRHPAYVGWFWWSVGTQVVLCNPVCLVAYALVSWRFFSERIDEEELLLINFFGGEYIDYQRRVPTGLPGISGYHVE